MTATLGPGQDTAAHRMFHGITIDAMVASMAAGAVHLVADVGGGRARLEGTVTRVEYLNGGVLSWWFRGTATADGRTADVLMYSNLTDAAEGVVWLRDDAGFAGRPWLKVDVRTLGPLDPARKDRLRALAADHFALGFTGSTITPMLPWVAGVPWGTVNGGVASGPFREQHRGRAAVRFDLRGHQDYPGTCRLWVGLDGLPVEQTGCISPAVTSVVWSDYGQPGTGYVPPPDDQVTLIADLLG